MNRFAKMKKERIYTLFETLSFLAFELNRELNQKTTWQQVLASCVTNQKCLQTERIR